MGEICDFGPQIEVPFVVRHFRRECNLGAILVNGATEAPELSFLCDSLYNIMNLH